MLGLCHTVKSTGRDLVRAQLADVAADKVPETQVCAVFLTAAREMIG